jgi:aspartate 1-decarboxylase
MFRQFLRCKLHLPRVTEANVEYTGSLTIDEEIMETAGIEPFEKLLIGNVENGARLETYAIPGPRGSREIGLNGAAARLGSVGDRLIVMVFGIFADGERPSPKVLLFDENNEIVKITEGS